MCSFSSTHFIYKINIFLPYVRMLWTITRASQKIGSRWKTIKYRKLFFLLKKLFPRFRTTLFTQAHKIILCYCLRFKLEPTACAITRRCDCDHGPTSPYPEVRSKLALILHDVDMNEFLRRATTFVVSLRRILRNLRFCK